MNQYPSSIVVVHGGRPTGADYLASQWAEGDDEVHAANWSLHGKAAGPIRNKEMVQLGADICLAFLTPDSVGGKMTADMAESAGIRTLRFYQ